MNGEPPVSMGRQCVDLSSLTFLFSVWPPQLVVGGQRQIQSPHFSCFNFKLL